MARGNNRLASPCDSIRRNGDLSRRSDMKNWKRSALRRGLSLGLVIFIQNCILTFVYLSASWSDILSYAIVPFILLFAGLSGRESLDETKKMRFAVLGGVLTVTVSLIIGFVTLFLLTFLFRDIVSHNPLTILNFQKSGQGDFHQFLLGTLKQAVLTSVPVSLTLGAISGLFGGLSIRIRKNDKLPVVS
jgi:hypothetical protein